MASPQTIQPATVDTYISSAAPNANYSITELLDTRTNTSSLMVSILTFDFSAVVPAGATITLATLSLYDYYPSTGRTIVAYRMLRTNYVDAQATWNIYKTGSNWGTAGALNSTTDYTTTNSASATTSASAGWINWTVTAQVQTALDSISGIAYFLLRDTGSASRLSENGYRSSNYTADTTLRPKLYIEYTVHGTNMQINISDTWKVVSGMQINISDVWKPVTKAQINIGGVWKSIF